MSEWKDRTHVEAYLAMADQFPHRLEGEAVLIDHLPAGARRILDLGTGSGRLLAMIRSARPEAELLGLDFSEVMLEQARQRFGADEGVELLEHDFSEPLPELGRFDAIVSSMAIHHLEHERKQELFAEVYARLGSGGTFANFDHVASATERLHEAFFDAIGVGVEHEDPSDRTTGVEPQLGWLRAAGFDDVDCYWKWLEMALMIGVREPG